MHREVLGLKKGDGLRGDHVEPRKTLDNRQENLRIATPSGNQHNQRMRKSNKTGFKGVSYNNRDKKFFAKIQVNYKQIALGYFDTAESAYNAYCEAAKIHHGEFARTS